MESIEQMIKRLCPKGVEWKRLGDLLYSIRTGLNPRKFFSLNTPDATNYYVTIKEFKGGNLVFGNNTDMINDEAMRLCNNRSHLEEGDLLFSGTGTIGEVLIVKETPRNWNIKEGVYALKPKTEEIKVEYLKHILQNSSVKAKLESISEGGTVKSISMKKLADFVIPVPPLEIQSRIVEVLDKMTTLTAELEAELEARKQQYEYYRNMLLSFNEIGEANRQVTWKKISEIGQICMCKRIMKDQTHKQGEIPFYKIGTFGGTADAYISRELFEDYRARFKFPKKGDLLISAAGTIGKTVVFDGKDSYFQDSNIVWVDNDETIVTNRYLYHIYKIINWKTDGGTIRRLYNDNLRNTIIPVPSMQEQQLIVSILDRFEALTTDLQSGLPAEIEARRQQYEYYRNKLLTFETV